MIVHKFGGTSVGDAGCFSRVAEIVERRRAGEPSTQAAQTVIVVSAMSGITDQLIAGARAAAEGRDTRYREIKAGLLHRHLEVVDTLLTRNRERLDVGGMVEDRLHELERFYRSIAMLGEFTVRGYDAVVSFGEELSVNILAAVLRERGVRAQALSATELIVTDDNFGAAAPLMEETRERLAASLLPLLHRGTVPVITGFIGANQSGVPTTLGRGGSDFSAAIIGACLGAEEVWIWSDVDGILTADPNIVLNARSLAELSYSEAADLAYYGADVLDPKTIRPVTNEGIPLRILNTFNPEHPGTRIVREPSSGRNRLPSIISTKGLSLIAVGSSDDSWTLQLAARALLALSDAGVEILMFSQSFSEHSLNLVVRDQDQRHALRTLRRAFQVGAAGGDLTLGTKEQVATVSVVGVPDWNQTGTVSHAFAALGKRGTRVIAVAQASVEHSVSFCIPEDQMDDTVCFLHRELGLEG